MSEDLLASLMDSKKVCLVMSACWMDTLWDWK